MFLLIFQIKVFSSCSYRTLDTLISNLEQYIHEEEKTSLFGNSRLFISLKHCSVLAFYVRCSNEDCEEKLLLDGEEIGVLNMKSYLVAHEVLRDYMYQFLYARFVRQAVFLMKCKGLYKS